MLLIGCRLIDSILDTPLMDIRKQIGKNLRAIREKRGWTQEELADYSGLHRTYISGVERGLRNPTIQIVARLSKALRVVPAIFFTETDLK